MSTYLAQIDFENLNRSMKASGFKFAGETIGDVISDLLPYLFVFAGLILLLYLIWGGFALMTSGGDPKAMDQAKGKITNAVIGFLIIFVSFWLIQILQTIFGLPKIF